MSRLSDLTAIAARQLAGNMSFVKGVLAINAASAATVKTTNALTYTVNGVQLAKAALAAQSIVPTHTNHGNVVGGSYIQPISSTVYYTLALDSAGVVSVVQGSFAGQPNYLTQLGVSAVGDGFVPDVPMGTTPIGVIKVVTNGATTFTPGTTALDAAGVTATYFDVNVLPVGAL